MKKERDSKVLRLTLKKKWFDLIVDGKKKFEYREAKPYWRARLQVKNAAGYYGGSRHFDEIRFENGYGRYVPFCRVEFNGDALIYGRDCEPENGEPLERDELYFVIALGNILEVGNLGGWLARKCKICGKFINYSGHCWGCDDLPW